MADVPLMNNPMTTDEDVIKAGASGVPERLAVGSNGNVLTVTAGVVGWAAPAGGGATFTGQPVTVIPQSLGSLQRIATNAVADNGRATPIVIPGSMRVRAMWIDISSSAAGSLQWGIYDYSSNEAACTELVTGTGASGGTGWRSIAATSAPVVVAAGAYMLIVKQPAATQPTIHTTTHAAAAGFWKSYTAYTWDTTPDLTDAGWVDATAMFNVYIEGDLDASGTRW